MTPRRPGALSRRQMLAGSGLATAALVAAAGTPSVAGADPAPSRPGATEPFHGPHQGGIATPEQARLVFATFDVTGTDRSALARLLTTWTRAAERMTAGQAIAG
ncbi:MAG TPA: Dyp-type peroxidase domain-containing protein, partial [Acidimicrobiales bacterium]